MFDDAKRYLTRKFKKIEFLTTSYPQDYETTNTEYRRLRNELSKLNNVVEKLSTYEFGGSIMKNVTDISKKITYASNLEFLNSEGIYTEAAHIGEDLANASHSSGTKNTSNKFAAAYQKVAEAKVKMNGDLDEIKASMKLLKEDTKVVDSLRRKAEDLRFELEEKNQEHTGTKSEIEALTTSFNSKALEALRGMRTFIGDAGVAGLLKRIVKTHKEFSEVSAKALTTVE